MSGLTRHLYAALGGLVMLAVLTPELIRLFVAAAPVIAITGVVVVTGRLVWFYTNRY